MICGRHIAGGSRGVDDPWCGEGSQYPTMPLTIGRYIPGLRPLCSMFMQNTSVDDDIAT